MIMHKKTFAVAIASYALLQVIGTSMAGEPIIAYTDHSRVLSVARPPGTVIVGNPSIADVTIQGDQVFLHAKSYGNTNILILDEAGNHLADYEVTVQTGGDTGVYVFKAGLAQTYVCAPECEATLRVGDYSEYFNGVAKQQQKRNSIALGAKDGESPAPEGQNAPQ
ncbi:MAG: pilus assembly protein N-terminal domain-containing protein [Alphaproteobacteria bacterium]|nr:pilus assembly protein N-terminal domain-containing protein [Alphaproteobacteria bacterium]